MVAETKAAPLSAADRPGPLRTEFAFVLPRGYVDEQGVVIEDFMEACPLTHLLNFADRLGMAQQALRRRFIE